MKPKTEFPLASLYHLDMLLWVVRQPWDDRFVAVIDDAQAYRDILMFERITPNGKD